MIVVKRILKYLFYVLSVPVIYVLIALLLGSITVNKEQFSKDLSHKVYLATNGVHLDIIVPKALMSKELMKGLRHHKSDRFFAFGWGDKNFYLNTPTWTDLTFKNAFSAMFLKSKALMHVTRHKQKRSDWIAVNLNKMQLEQLNTEILNTFELPDDSSKIILQDKGYGINDDFYKAKGSYSIFKTCNTWVNSVFKTSGLIAAYWTPFDFALINKYN